MRFASRFWIKGDRKSPFSLLISFGVGILLVLTAILPGTAVPIGDVPHPQAVDGTWVLDAADVLSDRTETELNQLLTELEAETGTEMAVATVPDILPLSATGTYAADLFDDWELGKAGENNGVLLLLIEDKRLMEVRVGEAAQLRLTDKEIRTLEAEQVRSQLAAGDFDAGALAATQEMVHELEKISPLEIARDIQESIHKVWLWAGWLSPALILCVPVIVAGTALKFMIPGYLQPVRIEPVGESLFSETEQPPSQYWVAALHFLIGCKMLAAKEIRLPEATQNSAFRIFQGQPIEESKDALNRLSRRSGDRISQDLLSSSKKLFGVLLAAAIATAVMFQFAPTVLLLPCATWLWAGGEARLNISWVNKFGGNKANSGPPVDSQQQWIDTAGFLIKVGTVGMVLSVVIGSIIPFAVWAMPFLATAFYGTCAGLLRIVRSLPTEHPVHCTACGDTMEPISNTNIKQHLYEPQQVELELGAVGYEGWRCSNCSFYEAKNGLSIHLFSWVMNNKYETCPDCEAQTVEVTSETLTPATMTTEGTQIVSHTCQCCNYTHEREVSLASVVPTGRLSEPRDRATDVSGYYVNEG